MKQEKPLKEVRPVVVPAQYYVLGPLAAAFLSLFPGMFAFIISKFIADSIETNIPLGPIAYCLSFAIVMYFLYLKSFKEPEKTLYRIFEDRLEYSEGFLNRQQRTVVFNQVIDVKLTEGLLQQPRNAGSITLITQQLVASGDGKMSNRGVVLKNVPNPQELYEFIRDLAISQNK